MAVSLSYVAKKDVRERRDSKMTGYKLQNTKRAVLCQCLRVQGIVREVLHHGTQYPDPPM